MRSLPALAAALVCSLPTLSLAYCFSVYSPQNQLVYQSTSTPVDLSRQISAGLRERYPNHHLVFVPYESSCAEVGSGGAKYVTQGNRATAAVSSLDAVPTSRSRRRDRE